MNKCILRKEVTYYSIAHSCAFYMSQIQDTVRLISAAKEKRSKKRERYLSYPHLTPIFSLKPSIMKHLLKNNYDHKPF